MDKELENRINDTASPLKIELNGEIRLTPQTGIRITLMNSIPDACLNIRYPHFRKGGNKHGKTCFKSIAGRGDV